jgi:putative redox protein
MVPFTITYLGELRCEAVHGPSGTKLLSDAPVDNHGRGESFSPTDLLATAFGTCMLTVMGIAAKRDGVRLEGTGVQLEKHMRPPRRGAWPSWWCASRWPPVFPQRAARPWSRQPTRVPWR